MLKNLKKYQERLLKSFNIKYKRYIFREIDFDEKMIAIFGARGVGKTTTLFQYLLELQVKKKNVLYISLDYPFLSGVDLIEIVEAFVEEGGEFLEVKYEIELERFLKPISIGFSHNLTKVGSLAFSFIFVPKRFANFLKLNNPYLSDS